MRAGRSRRIESIVDAVGNTPLVRLRGIARELAGFLWAEMTHQPMREEVQTAA